MSSLCASAVIAETRFPKLQNEALIHEIYSSHVTRVIYPTCIQMGIFTALLHHAINALISESEAITEATVLSDVCSCFYTRILWWIQTEAQSVRTCYKTIGFTVTSDHFHVDGNPFSLILYKCVIYERRVRAVFPSHRAKLIKLSSLCGKSPRNQLIVASSQLFPWCYRTC